MADEQTPETPQEPTAEELEAQAQAEAAAQGGGDPGSTPTLDPDSHPDEVPEELVDVAASVRETERLEAGKARQEAAAAKGGLKRPVLHNGLTYPAGTDPSDLDLSDEQRKRLERIGAL